MTSDHLRYRTQVHTSSATSTPSDGCLEDASFEEAALAVFSNWLDGQLSDLEEQFRSFWTHRSVVGSLGR